ncbi:MAG: hypothetical protein F6K48_20695 [Okeania sp. SIO3H1]|nr:hypothetical protein [Okeania sp. SIO3H1]
MAEIILDCDGVLFDWETAFAEWLLETHSICTGGTEPKEWDLSKWINCSPEDTMRFVHDFNGSEAFGKLPVFPEAQIAVKKMASVGHRLHVITSCGVTWPIKSRRELNLKRAFGDIFSSITCLALGADKSPYLEALPRGIYVEDNSDHGVRGTFCGHKTFVLRRSHNRANELVMGSAPMVIWTDDWAPILEAALV